MLKFILLCILFILLAVISFLLLYYLDYRNNINKLASIKTSTTSDNKNKCDVIKDYSIEELRNFYQFTDDDLILF